MKLATVGITLKALLPRATQALLGAGRVERLGEHHRPSQRAVNETEDAHLYRSRCWASTSVLQATSKSLRAQAQVAGLTRPGGFSRSRHGTNLRWIPAGRRPLHVTGRTSAGSDHGPAMVGAYFRPPFRAAMPQHTLRDQVTSLGLGDGTPRCVRRIVIA
jgi:hypothetical protein